jgi:putative hydrolase of the HAD superfamily
MAWVMFDYGGVISCGPSEQDMTTIAGAAGIAVRRLAGAYWQPRPAYDRAELDARAYWQQVAELAGRGQAYSDAQVAELIRLDIDSWLHLHAGTVELIEELAASGHRRAMLADAPVETAAAIAALPVARYFDRLIFSCELKSSKPDTACFASALASLGAAAEDVIFVDDRAGDVAAAAAIGFRSVQFTSPGQARGVVAELLSCQEK